jgi:uncharacterized membrane protein YfcA
MTSELIVLCLAALLTSLLTFFSGFGLGTILMPVFAIFFHVDLAIALTGVVHFLNNLFKLFLIGRKADTQIVIRFGLPAFIAALIGAWLLFQVAELPEVVRYSLGRQEYVVTPVKLMVGTLLMFFALAEALPFVRKLHFGKNELVIGGLLSGFFGGLSGHQGALRSAFLLRANLNKEVFVATGIVIACIIDVSRLGVYATRFSSSGLGDNLTLVIAATLSAFIGAYIGNRLLQKVTLRVVQVTVTVMLFILSIALALGIV